MKFLRKIPLHPFLFSIFYVVSLYSHNIENLIINDIFRSLIAVLLFVSLVYLILYKSTNDLHRSGYLALVTFFFLFTYGSIYFSAQGKQIAGFDLWNHLLIFILFLFVFIIAVNRRIWAKVQDREFITFFFNAVAIASLVYPTYSIISSNLEARKSPLYGWMSQNSSPASGEAAGSFSKPDIYYIIVDGYARQDVLESLYDFDNREFIAFLEDRGFYVAENSSTNYVKTILSLASSLNMDYLSNLNPLGLDHYNGKQLVDLLHNSEVRRILNSYGYQFVAVDSGYEITKIKNSDVYYSNFPAVSQFEELFLSSTMMVFFDHYFNLGVPLFSSNTHRQRIEYNLSKLSEVPSLPGPKFVFSHLMMPHPPFVFDSQGDPVDQFQAFTIDDGSYFPGTKEEYRTGYVNQLIYTNQRLREIVDAILNNSAEPPIIIIQADHGPRMYANWEVVDGSCDWEMASILNAYYFPGNDLEGLYPDISPVNSFRLVFNKYINSSFSILEDETYSGFMTPEFMLLQIQNSDAQSCKAAEE